MTSTNGSRAGQPPPWHSWPTAAARVNALEEPPQGATPPEVGWAESEQYRLAVRPRPAPVPGAWSFWANMLVPAASPPPIGGVDVAAFTCTRKLSGVGNGTAVLAMPCGVDPDRLLRLWSWRLWAFYEGRPYWCGVPTGVADNGEALVTVTMTEITGYLAKRQWDIGPPSRRYNQAEQTSIARDIAAPLADVGVDIVTEPGPGFPRDREYEFMESEHRLRLLENLSNVIEGPEYRTEYRMTTQGQPRATLRIAYPRVGTGEAGLGLIVPGEALDFGAAWDADKLRTRTFAVGELPEDAPEGTLRPVVVRDVPQNDLPRLDEADDYPGVILVSTLTERAAAESVRQGSPALQLQLAVPEAAPPLLAYGPGDDVTIRVTTPLLSGGLEVDGALTEIEVDAATGKTTWTVVIGLPPPRPRESLMARLNRIDYVTRGTFRRRLEAL